MSHNSLFARQLHEEMIQSLFANQGAKQAAAVTAHEARLAELREREAATEMEQPPPQIPAPPRFKAKVMGKRSKGAKESGRKQPNSKALNDRHLRHTQSLAAQGGSRGDSNQGPPRSNLK